MNYSPISLKMNRSAGRFPGSCSEQSAQGAGRGKAPLLSSPAPVGASLPARKGSVWRQGSGWAQRLHGGPSPGGLLPLRWGCLQPSAVARAGSANSCCGTPHLVSSPSEPGPRRAALPVTRAMHPGPRPRGCGSAADTAARAGTRCTSAPSVFPAPGSPPRAASPVGRRRSPLRAAAQASLSRCPPRSAQAASEPVTVTLVLQSNTRPSPEADCCSAGSPAALFNLRAPSPSATSNPQGSGRPDGTRPTAPSPLSASSSSPASDPRGPRGCLMWRRQLSRDRADVGCMDGQARRAATGTARPGVRSIWVRHLRRQWVNRSGHGPEGSFHARRLILRG